MVGQMIGDAPSIEHSGMRLEASPRQMAETALPVGDLRMSKPAATRVAKSSGLQPPRSKTTVTRRSPTSLRTSPRSLGSIATRLALASAVNTRSGSPRASFIQ